jgi:adenine-specific DNA-methyltransferase
MPTVNFKGKTAVENHSFTVPHRVLDIASNLSEPKGQDSLDGNLIIEGDNLAALKSLLPTHSGRIKCIYIDPPYNTGTEKWVFNDNLTQPQFKEWLNREVGKEGEDISRHDKWCCMMYPRLQLLKELLHEDGAIFISIDDNEVHHLRMMMDELFGPENIIGTIVWRKGKKGDTKFLSVTHEYILAAVKDKAGLKTKKVKWRRKKRGAEEVLAHYDSLVAKHGKHHERIQEEMRAWYAKLADKDPRKRHKHYNWSDDRGLYFAADFAGPDDGRKSRPRHDIIHPKTKLPCEKPSTGWRWDQKKTDWALAEKPPRIHFGPDHTTVPNRKTYLKETMTEPFRSVLYKDGRAATLLLEQMIGPGKMDFPKDKDVLATLFSLCTGPNDTILDSFGGSGTTAHAVLQLNKEQKSNRRFILIQQPFDTKRDEEQKFNICEEVTRERVLRAINGYMPLGKNGKKGAGKKNRNGKNGNGKPSTVPGLGGSFTYVRLGEPLLDEYRNFHSALQTGQFPPYDEVAKYVFFTETSRPLGKGQINRDTMKIGEAGEHSYYLLYTPKADNDVALNREFLESVRSDPRRKVIYAEKIHIRREDLKDFGDVRAMAVPFNLR